MTRSVAFFRNLNLGQGWAPTRVQLLDAFVRAGASGAENVQVNGTVVFDAPAPLRTARRVVDLLRPLTGYDDLVVVRPASWVQALAPALRAFDHDTVAVEVATYDARRDLPPLPWTAPDGRLDVVAGDRRHAVTVFRPDGRRGSNATVVVERLLGVKVTSRGAGTMLRLAERLGG